MYLGQINFNLPLVIPVDTFFTEDFLYEEKLRFKYDIKLTLYVSN